MTIFNPLSNSFGIDIGDRSLKLVQLSPHRSGTAHPKLKAWGSVNIPDGIMDKGDVVDMKRSAALVGQLLHSAKGHVSGRAVVACLPEARCFLKIIEIDDKIPEEEMRRAILHEIEMNIPLPLNEIYFDWQKIELQKTPIAKPAKPAPIEKKAAAVPVDEDSIDSTDSTAPETPPPPKPEPEPEEPVEKPPKKTGTVRVLLAATPKKTVEDYTQMLEMAGLAPIAFEVESMSIARAIIPHDEIMTEPLGILDIGATRSSLIICDSGAIQMSISIPLSGNEITQIIAQKLGVGQEDAETVKKECGLDAHRCEDKMWNILLPLIDDMSSKIRNALRFFKIGFPSGRKIERLWLCGGGAHFRDIDSVLSRKLTIKVQRGDAQVNLSRPPKSFPSDANLTYATAIGLALRASEEGAAYRKSFRI